MKTRKRPYYRGNVPKPLLRPIRAGLLQSVDNIQLIGLIATLEPIPNQCAAATDPAQQALAVARAHIESIVAGNYTRVQLLDSVFWGDDTITRKDGHRYIRPTKRARVDTGLLALAPLIPYDFRSPPWGPVWPAPDDRHRLRRVASLLHPETCPGFGESTKLAEIVVGDVIEVWPALSRFLLALPSPLRPWRVDPAYRRWYADTLGEFLTQCLLAAAPVRAMPPPRGRADDDDDRLLRSLLDTLRASPDALEDVLIALESAHVSRRPPRRPPADGDTPAVWPLALLESARRRAAIWSSKRYDCTVIAIIHENIVPLWPEVACAWLGIPCPLGAWRLRRSHLQHCYCVLMKVTENSTFPSLLRIRDHLERFTENDDCDILRLLHNLQARHASLSSSP